MQRIGAILRLRGSSFQQESEGIIHELETLALEADAAHCVPLERARNWRCLGEAYSDLGRGNPAQLGKALSAYREAELLLSGVESCGEEMLVNYGIGRTILHLGRSINLPLAREARRRYLLALNKARLASPEFENRIQEDLMNLDHVLTLLEERSDLYGRIDSIKSSRKNAGSDEYDLDIQIPEDAAIFEQLLDIYHRMSQLGGFQKAAV